MTSDRQRRANGANARASTGPKTRAGKARSARNALRQGLNIPVWSDPALAPQAEAIALVIAGPNADAETLDYARQISEAQVDLNRVRSLRTEVIARILSHPRSPPLEQVRLQGNRIWNLAATLAGFCVSGEIDFTGSRIIRGAGECFGSLYRMLERFGRPSHWQCGAA